MRKILKIIIGLLSISLLIVGCDPPHYITFVNSSGSELEVTFKLDTTHVNYSLYENKSRKADSIVLYLSQGDSTELHFGIGTWSDSEISGLANSLREVRIENNGFKSIYKSHERIERFLKENRKSGIMGNGWSSEILVEID